MQNREFAMTTTDPDPALRPYPWQYISSWTMRDGTQVTIRPIRPEDEPVMVKFHGTLSDRTVYMRYFSSLSEIVLVAEHKDPQTGAQHILAVGRLNKLQADGKAEIAVLVSDEYQHKGLGTELLRRLVQVARDEKVRRLVAEMLRDNLAIHTIFKRLGFRLRLVNDPGSVQAILDL